MIRRAERRLLRLFGRFERPAAWVLLFGAMGTFVGVVLDLVKTGDAKWVTILVAADLTVSGWSALQDAEDNEDDQDGRAA